MYIVKPITYSTLWGDQRLYAYAGDRNQDSIGIVYTVSGIESFDCPIENKEEKTTLRQAILKSPTTFGLKEGEEYPVIIAFDSCKESVSFQIHPTDAYAKEKLNLNYGKSEAWYFIDPPTDHWVYAENLKESKEAIIDGLEKNDFTGIIGHKPVQKGDLVYIRSGTIHALTKGSLIYEIQQSTNITYRLYDYDRIDARTGKKRDLHIQESLANHDPLLKVQKESFGMNSINHQREFSLKHTVLENNYTNESSIASAISIISGTFEVEGYTIVPGQSVLVLPNETIQIKGSAECIIATVHPYWRSEFD